MSGLDFNDLARERGGDAVRAAIEGARPVERPAAPAPASPKPLPSELPDVQPFPLAALPDDLRPWVQDVSERMQCPPDFIAVPMLVAAASLTAKRVAMRPQANTDWTVRPSLWAMIVGRPGAMKSPAMQQALAPMERLEKRARSDNAEALKAFETDRLAAKLRRDAAERTAKDRLKKDPGADLHSLLAEVEEPKAPPRTRYLVNDCTYEALGTIMDDNPGGTMAVRDELKSLLADLSKEEKAPQRGFFIQAWSGGSYTFDRIGRGHLHIEDARLSMVGGIQPGPLSELVKMARSAGSAADGLLERFLIAWPDDPGQWRDVDRLPDSDAKRRAFAAFDRLDKLAPEGIGAEQDRGRDGAPRGPYCLRFDPPARESFGEWRADLEQRIKSGELGDMESALAKFRHHVPALALVAHLFDGNAGPVSERATLRALALADYGQRGQSKFDMASYAAFGEASYELLPKLTGTLGLRYTYEDKSGRYATSVSGGRDLSGEDPATAAELNRAKLSILRPQDYTAANSGGNLSGRANLAYQLMPALLGYASYAYGYKSGGLNMSGLPLNQQNQPALGTAVIRDEKNQTIELGLKSSAFGGRATANVALYRTVVENYQANIVSSSETAALRSYPANIPEVRVQGAELDLAAIPLRGLQIRASLAYADGKNTDYPAGPCPLEVQTASTVACNLTGTRIAGLSKWVATVGFDYTLPLGPGAVVLHADSVSRTGYNSDTSASKYTEIGGYSLINASLGYRLASGWEVDVFARNLFDRDYITALTIQTGNSGLILGQPSDPRLVGVTLRYRI